MIVLLQNALHEKTYGKSFTSSTPASAIVLENPMLIVANSKKREKLEVEPQSAPVVVKTQQPTAAVSVSSKPMLNKQIETRTADGRRRITPVFIPPAADLG